MDKSQLYALMYKSVLSVCQHSRLPPDRHGQPAISATCGPGDGCGGHRLTPRALSVDRRSGYKTRMKSRRGKKRSTPTEERLGKVPFYSLQRDPAYFHRPLKLDKKHQGPHKAVQGTELCWLKKKQKTRRHTDRNENSSHQKNTTYPPRLKTERT